jgi:predicted lipid-binding transport protein (Tim44 family)
MERQVVQAEQAHDNAIIKQGDRGQWMAFGVALCGFVLVGFLAYLKEPILAGIIAALDIGSLVAAFLYGRKKQAEERIAEAQQPKTLDASQAGPSPPTKQLPAPKNSKPATPQDSKPPPPKAGDAASRGDTPGKKPQRRKKR